MIKVSFVFLLLMSWASSAAPQSKFSGLVVFGDSLSDTGNLASVSANFPFPFFENRISNGPVLVDYLAEELGFQALASQHTISNRGGDNFAVSGGNVMGSDVEDLGPQIDSFLARENGLAEANSLYFLMIGGNDLRDIRSIVSREVAESRIVLVLQKFELELNRLYDAGARTFMVSNVADIGSIPETIERQVNDSGISQRARSYVEIYNRQLAALLQRFESKPGVSLSLFDLFGQLDQILNTASSLGFTQTQVGCFTFDRLSFHPDCRFGTRFDRFVFFDNIHPSARTNQIASRALISSIPALDIAFPDANRKIITPALQLLLLDE